MDRQDVITRLIDIFRDVFDDETITIHDETTAADIEDWDSLTHITLISEVEEEFGCKFSMKAVLELKNVGEMIDYIMTNQN